MQHTEIDTANFGRVAALNEAAKELMARSHHVNRLALDAMVQSKATGANLRGFDEVSSQMRHWSRDLHGELERLRTLSRELVVEVSHASKEAHVLRLLRRATIACSGTAHPCDFSLQEAAHLDRLERLRKLWRSMVLSLSDLDQLGLMAMVLSRSAMIEASSGTSEQRAQLGRVSQEFYQNSEFVISLLRSALKAVR